MKPIRVLIADDAVVVRRILTTVIDEDPELEVVGVAVNGAIALQKLEQLKPDIITLDIEMPEMDGLQALRALRKTNRDIPVIMFSTLTERGAAATLEALSLGASDYVTKPANVGSVNAAMESVRRELIPRIKSLCRRPGASRPGSGGAGIAGVPGAPTSLSFPPLARTIKPGVSAGRVDVVAIGSSTGGPMALSTVLASLPADLRVPVVITQHMPPVFTRLLAQRLDASIPITVKEAERGDLLRPGLVLIAPGDFHMVFKRSAMGIEVDLNQHAPVNFCRPAVDTMFESIASLFRGDVLAVVLIGMGHDGRDGCATLREKGAQVIAQDEATSVVWGMPGAVATAGLADTILPIDEIGPKIVSTVNGALRKTQVA
jgi:two-component system, chemotaxis family, protein-glutamate methylesterase/glutaminase